MFDTLQNTSLTLGIAVSAIAIFTFVGARLGVEVERRRKTDTTIDALVKQSKVHDQMLCDILRLVFNVGNEMVKQGANGELKRAVNELRETVVGIATDGHCGPQ